MSQDPTPSEPQYPTPYQPRPVQGQPQYPVEPYQQYSAQQEPPYAAPQYQQQYPGYATQQVYGPQPAFIPQARPANGFAIASLILSIFGICVGIIPFFIGLFLSFAPCVLGITFGILGLVRANRIGGYGFGMALAGLIVAGANFLLYFTGYGIFW